MRRCLLALAAASFAVIAAGAWLIREALRWRP